MLAPEVVDTANFVHSPMPGVLVSLSVEPGQHIENGQEICVMEVGAGAGHLLCMPEQLKGAPRFDFNFYHSSPVLRLPPLPPSLPPPLAPPHPLPPPSLLPLFTSQQAMKMQNVLRSPRAGVVAECHAVAGQKLDVDQLIVSLVSEEADINEEIAA